MNEDFRTQFQYNNIMFMVAGEVANKVTNIQWEDLVIDKLFKPLNMTNSNTRTYPLFEKNNNIAGAFYPSDDKFTYFKEIKHHNFTLDSAAGSIISNVIDMSKWLRMLINKGKYKNITIIEEKEINQLYMPHIILPSGGFINSTKYSSSYGLGWFVNTKDNNYIISHGGNLEGSSSYIAFWPELEFGIVILSNRYVTQLPQMLSLAAYEIFFNKDLYDCNKYKYEGILYERSIINFIKEININFKKNRIHNTSPKFPLYKYKGIFENPGYGIFNISLNNNRNNEKLKLKWFNNDFNLIHYHYDTFFIKSNFGFMFISFNIDKKENISDLFFEINTLEDKIRMINFKKIK
jgi:hypothetical protein